MDTPIYDQLVAEKDAQKNNTEEPDFDEMLEEIQEFDNLLVAYRRSNRKKAVIAQLVEKKGSYSAHHAKAMERRRKRKRGGPK